MALIDFGIAQRRQDGDPITGANRIVGTPQYMAPEQASGQPIITPAADIFSLGCVLFECIAGQPPFAGEQLAVILSQLLFAEAPSLKGIRPGLPDELDRLDELLQRMLAKDPAQRPRHASALITELDGLTGVFAEVEPPARGAQRQVVALVAGEQRLVSVIMATVPRAAADGLSADDEPQAGIAEPSRLAGEQAGNELALDVLDDLATLDLPQGDATLEGSGDCTEDDGALAALRALGAQITKLKDGALLATFSSTQVSSATDQAIQAAQGALSLRRNLPAETRIVVCTARALMHHGIPQGEVMERVEEINRRHRAAAQRAGEDPKGPLLDDATAGLLAIDSRFLVQEQAGGCHVLIGEKPGADTQRPLLGRETPCVGRESELQILLNTAADAAEGSSARAVLVMAPPGTGKSRLRQEFLSRLQARSLDMLVIRGTGDPMSAGSSYAVLGQAIRKLCGVLDGEELPVQRDKLSQRLRLHVPPQEAQRVVDFLGELCGIPSAQESAALRAARQDPRLRNERIGQALIDFLRAECAVQLVLLILEDLHWGDILSIRQIDQVLRELPSERLMIFALARPEVKDRFPNLWSKRSLYEMRLAGLSRRASIQLIQHVLGNQIDQALCMNLVDQAAGNALFLEELIRAYAAGGGRQLPDTVVAMIQVRLGRLEPGPRKALRVAGVFGERFWLGGLKELLGADMDPEEVERCVEILIESEFIMRSPESRFSGETEYGFRSALIQKAAYGLLTDSARLSGHHRAGPYLERVGESDFAVLAEHAYCSGEMGRAIGFFLSAARQAYDNSDVEGALALVGKGVACGAEGEALGALRCIEAMAHRQNRDAARCLAANKEALALLQKGSDYWYRAFMIAIFHSGLMTLQGDTADMVQLALEIEPAPFARSCWVEAAAMLLSVLCQRGQGMNGRELRGRLLRAKSDGWDKSVAARSSANMGLIEYYRTIEPEPWLQLQLAREAAEAAAEAQDERTLTFSQNYLGQAYMELGDFAAAEEVLRANLALAVRLQEPIYLPFVKLHLAALLALPPKGGAHAEAGALADEIVAMKEAVSRGFLGWAHGIKASILLAREELAAAQEEALAAVEHCAQVPLRCLLMRTTLVYIYLKMDRGSEACRAAEQGLRSIELQGGCGYSAVGMYVAAAAAQHAVGDCGAARRTLRTALAEIGRRADGIPDAEARRKFLCEVPDCARAHELKRTWLLTQDE